jgi:EKC/KEOPS complex subunit CGI121/TPRKB
VLKSPEQSFAEHLANNVQGEAVAMTDEALASLKDDARIRKIYRLDQPKKGESAVLGKEAEAFVIGSMALKGA